MRRSEAEQAMREGREVLRKRSHKDVYGTRVRIAGIGWSRDRWGRQLYAHGTGIKCEHLDRDGLPTGRFDVYPLGQLSLSTVAELREETRLREERAQAAARARREDHDARRVRATAVIAVLGVGRVQVMGTPAVVLTVEEAESLAARLTPSTESATVGSPTERNP